MTEYVYSDTIRRSNLVDEYLTPPKLAVAMADLLGPNLSSRPVSHVLEPGADTGIISAAVKADYTSNVILTGVEIMEEVPIHPVFDHYYGGTDFISWEAPRKYHAVIMNPPYSKPKKDMAELFIRRSWELLERGGIMVALLRASFPCAAKRVDGLFKEIPLYRWYWIKRPSFNGHDPRTEQYGTKNTNMHDYAVGVWIKDFIPTHVESGWLEWK